MHISPATLEELRSKTQADRMAGQIWSRVKRSADRGLSSPLPEWSARWEFDAGLGAQRNLGSVVSEGMEFVTSLCMAFLVTGEAECARRAKEITLAFCEFPFWASPIFFRSKRVPWLSTIEGLAVNRLAAYCYDWLYDVLSEEERECIRFNLAYKGIMPAIHDWADPLTRTPVASHLKPNGNWWLHCTAVAGEAALALLDHSPTQDIALRWVGLAKDAVRQFIEAGPATIPELEDAECQDMPIGSYYPPNFDSEGAYQEGLNYADWVLTNTFLFSEALSENMGEGLLSTGLMQKVADWLLYCAYSDGGYLQAVNFDDTRKGFCISPMVTAFLSRKLRHPGMQWYLASTYQNLERGAEEKLWLLQESPALTFLFYDPSVPAARPDAPVPVKVFPGAGWAVIRSGWSEEDTFFAVKCGGTVGHAHPDAGGFVLNHAGTSLLVDSGVSSYEVPEHQSYYQTSRAHNVVLVGGRGQTKRLPGTLGPCLGVSGCVIVSADASAPYEGVLTRFVRKALWLKSKCFLLVDFLEKSCEDPFEWLLHYDGELSRSEDGAFVIMQEKSGVMVRFLAPAEVAWNLKDGYKPTAENLRAAGSVEEKSAQLENAEYLSVSPVVNSASQVFISLVWPFCRGEELPVVKACHTGSALRLDVRETNDSKWGALVSLGPPGDPAYGPTPAREPLPASRPIPVCEPTQPDREIDLRTDACFYVCLTDPAGRPTHIAAESASFVATRGFRWMSSSSPVTLAGRFRPHLDFEIWSSQCVALDLRDPAGHEEGLWITQEEGFETTAAVSTELGDRFSFVGGTGKIVVSRA